MIQTNSHGTNAKFQFHILSDKDMRKCGFTNYYKPNWFFCRNLGNGIEFNITIPKDGSEAWIDVLDSDFCQPYDYQYILENKPTHEFALKIKSAVEDLMVDMQNKCIISNYEVGDYI